MAGGLYSQGQAFVKMPPQWGHRTFWHDLQMTDALPQLSHTNSSTARQLVPSTRRPQDSQIPVVKNLILMRPTITSSITYLNIVNLTCLIISPRCSGSISSSLAEPPAEVERVQPLLCQRYPAPPALVDDHKEPARLQRLDELVLQDDVTVGLRLAFW